MINLVMTQYIEINLIGVIVLLTMLFYIIGMRQSAERDDQRNFVKLLICNVAILVSDIAIYLMRGHGSLGLIAINHLVCSLYFILHSYFGYLWIRYSIKKLYPEFEPGCKLKALLILPGLMNMLMILSSPWTNWIYSLTSTNQYMRGTYIWAAILISYLYWVMSAVLVVWEMLAQKRIREQTVYTTLLIFPIPTLIGNLLQMQFYGLSIVWVCSAISLLILFINLQNDQLTRDILTGLFNRRQTNMQIAWEINHLTDANYLLFVIMVDVDCFKEINDRFGHLVGDQALVAVSSVLKKGCREKDFIARFGGDEFIIVGHAKSTAEIELLHNNIMQQMQRHNSENALPYTLSLSAGYSQYSRKDILSIDSIISAADKAMYQMKNSKKCQVRL